MSKRLINTSIVYFCALLLTLFFIPAKAADDELFTSSLQKLTDRKFSKKIVAIGEIEKTGHPKSVAVFEAMLNSNLYYRKSDKKIVFVEKVDGEFKLSDILSNEDLGTVGKRKVKKVSINNKIRSILDTAIARLNLNSESIEERKAAVERITRNLSESSVVALKDRKAIETESSVIEAIDMALAFIEIKSNDENIKLAAIQTLAQSLLPEAKSLLNDLLAKNEKGEYVESSAVRKAAKEAISSIDTRLKLYSFTETLFFGLSLGSVLLLSAIGLAITFGVMGVINMAHGELMMLGAYTTYVVQLLMPNNIEYSLFVAVPAAFLVAGFVGILIERGCLKFLYGRPLETLLATFGISLILQQLVRTIFSPLNRAVETPGWMSGAWEINSALSITYNRLYIIIFSLIVFAALIMILKRTSLGLYIRAVSQNRSMAKAMGVRSEWVDALTFGLGSGIAGIAGVALSQLTNVGPNLGQAYIIDSFMVVVFGGVGNLWGTFVGAMSLGVVNKFLEPWSGAVLAKIIVLVFIILFIQKKPKGLFPQKGRAAEN